MEDKIILTDNGKIVLLFMQNHDKIYVGKDLGELVQIKGIYPVLNSLIRHKLVELAEPITRDFTDSKGILKPKEYKTYQLTEFGKKFQVN